VFEKGHYSTTNQQSKKILTKRMVHQKLQDILETFTLQKQIKK
jgi:hypothetical protein